MEKASDYLQAGIDDLIFTRQSHKDGDAIMVELTREFINSFRHVTQDVNYQSDIDGYILKALAHHYRRVLKVEGENWDTDKMSSLAYILGQSKKRLLIPQTQITKFRETKKN